MGVVLYAPSLALNAVTDFPIWASIVAVGGCAAIYTAMVKKIIGTENLTTILKLFGLVIIFREVLKPSVGKTVCKFMLGRNIKFISGIIYSPQFGLTVSKSV